jgi:hypothetical protein
MKPETVSVIVSLKSGKIGRPADSVCASIARDSSKSVSSYMKD